MPQARDTAALFVNAFNAHDEGAVRALFAPDTELQAPGGVKLTGRDAAAGYVIGWLKGFPDARMIVDNEVAGDRWVVQECTFEGTNTAPMESPTGIVPATGRKLNDKSVQVGRYEDGQVVKFRLYFDQLVMLEQLGLTPAVSASTSS
jgi:ketosteroid isomerase-like protein